ncbi:MAG: hypothetical protein ABR976_12055 [Terracidiphilus sp.]|jgi:hypothetical protein
MFVSKRILRRLPAASVLLALAALHFVPASRAQGTHLWTQSRIEDFEKGTPQGVALSSDGHLRPAPSLADLLTTPSTFVWSVAVDKAGTAYLGTGAPGAVLRVGPDGKPFTLFETKDLSVQSVRIGPDGALYAATMPSGKVYKLNPAATTKQDDSSATAIFEITKLAPSEKSSQKAADGKSSDDKADASAPYIWDMTFDAHGRLYIAAGGPGAVYRVDVTRPGAAPELFFKSDEEHIRCLAWDAKGNLIAGSDGSGLVYRISPEGKGYVLFEAPRREITAVAVGANGTIYAADVGDKSHNPLPPLPVQGVGSVTITIVQPQSLQAANTSTALPDGTEIYAIAADPEAAPQSPRRLWSGKDEIVYALAARPDGLLALSGNRGRVFRIADDGSYADVAHLDAQQGLSFAATENAVFIGTGNTGKLFRWGATAEKHEYASDVLDAGALARFGRIEVQPGSTGFELFTRTGNVEQPVRGWSDWLPLKDGAVASPAGRFLQWKAVLSAGASVGSVGVNYLPVNSAPVVDDLVVVPGARVAAQNQQASQQTVQIAFGSPAAAGFDGSANSPLQATKDRTAITVRWAAHDDDGDDLIYSIYLRGDGEKVWRLLKENITDKIYSFDATLIPDGGYQLKVVASDAPSHTPGEVLTGAKESERFEVDTTPPVISNLKAVARIECGGIPCRPPEMLVTFDAEDAFSPISHAEYSLDAGPWQFIQPVGALSDSRREHYQVTLPPKALTSGPGEHLITVRVYDRHDNVGLAKTVFTVPAAFQAPPDQALPAKAN